jgi:hypothetical protein
MPACSPEVPTSDVASMPTAATEVGAAHMAASKAGAAHVAATKVASSAEMSTTAVAGVRHDGRKKQATCKGSYCGYTHSHDYISFGASRA